VGVCCPLFGERVPVIRKEEWQDIIGDVELTSLVRKIKDQDGVGSCATESTSQAVEITRAFDGMPWVELNPWSIYCFTSGGRDNGSSIDENLVHVRQYGICPEAVWPRSKGWSAKPDKDAMEAAKLFKIDEFYDLTTTEEIGTALLLGFAVVFGWNGHSCVLTELLSASPSTAKYANSWSPQWGDEGFGTINLSSINFQYGAFAVRTITVPDALEPRL
jgi:hypothetical protein